MKEKEPVLEQLDREGEERKRGGEAIKGGGIG